MFRTARTALLTVCTLTFALSLAPRQADAQVEPFKVIGAGIAADGLPLTPDVPAPHWAVGHGTGLGEYFGSGFFEINKFTGPLTGDFSSAVPFVFKGAHGNHLACDYEGTVELFPLANGKFVAVFVATFTPVLDLCTGHFEDLTGGSFVMTAITEPFVLGSHDPTGYVWFGEGALIFNHGK
jgi:hypothetical protein